MPTRPRRQRTTRLRAGTGRVTTAREGVTRDPDGLESIEDFWGDEVAEETAGDATAVAAITPDKPVKPKRLTFGSGGKSGGKATPKTTKTSAKKGSAKKGSAKKGSAKKGAVRTTPKPTPPSAKGGSTRKSGAKARGSTKKLSPLTPPAIAPGHRGGRSSTKKQQSKADTSGEESEGSEKTSRRSTTKSKTSSSARRKATKRGGTSRGSSSDTSDESQTSSRGGGGLTTTPIEFHPDELDGADSDSPYQPPQTSPSPPRPASGTKSKRGAKSTRGKQAKRSGKKGVQSKAASSRGTKQGKKQGTKTKKKKVTTNNDKKRRREASESGSEDDLDDGSVRRSKRTRIRPVEFWKSEIPLYERRSSGVTLVDVVRLPASPPSAKKPKAKKNKAKKDSKIGKSSSSVTTSVLSSAGDSVAVEFARHNDALDMNRVTSKEDKQVDYSQGVAFVNPAFRSGLLTLKPNCIKPYERSGPYILALYLVSGSVSVALGGKKVALKAGTHFYIPDGNEYALSNRSASTEAKLVWFMISAPDEWLEE